MRKLSLLLLASLSYGASQAQFTVSTGGQKFVVIEEMTGKWCGYCPPGADRVHAMVASEPRAIAVAIHDNQDATPGNPNANDSMEIKEGATLALMNQYNAGYPSINVDRLKQSDGKCVISASKDWNAPLNARKATAPKVDVLLNHTYDPTTKTVTIKVTATTLEALTGEYNINAFIVEDNIPSTGTGYAQISFLYKNASSAYYKKGVPQMPDSARAILGPGDYKHQYVLRAVLGDTWGTTGVITKDPAANASFSKEYTFTLPNNFKTKDLKIIGLVQKHNPSSAVDREILNAVQAVFMPYATTVAEANKQLTKVEVYPNPATNNVIVRTYLNRPGEVNLTVTNSVGQVVINNTYNETSNMFTQNVSLDNMPSGNYFITVSSNGENHVEKLIVNK